MSDAVTLKRVQVLKNKEYGDFQTPITMCESVANLIHTTNFEPTILIEPSCGKGNFVVSALKRFQTIKTVIAIELQEEYREDFYSNLGESSLDLTNIDILFISKSFFELDFQELFIRLNINFNDERFLILGNPPWVTNSFLGSINSCNLPSKKNSKVKFKGLDALTGKSNFDIAETFILKLIDFFNNKSYQLALICKTSTVTNLVKNNSDRLSHQQLSTYRFNAKKEFGISASANILVMQKSSINSKVHHTCDVFELDNSLEKIYTYGFQNAFFVSNIDLYNKYAHLEGDFIYQWRQGLKHDASSILVLEEINPGQYKNKLQETIELEPELIYPFLKSSDIKKPIITHSRYYVLVTQEKLGEDTTKRLINYPKIWEYVNEKRDYFLKRKSRIYNNQSEFCVFGIGDYTFKPYKIAISGFYKKLQFSLLLPKQNKPILLDDTCYSLSFDSLEEAVLIWILLNSEIAIQFISSITFLESKRPYKKDILQRLDLKKMLEIISEKEIHDLYTNLLKNKLKISLTSLLKAKKDLLMNLK